MSEIISGGSNIVTTSHASSLTGSTLELLSYRLSAEVGAEVKLLEDKFNCKWILQLIAKTGKVISSVDISYIDIPSTVIESIELDYENKRLRFYFKNGKFIDCDISNLIAKIDELFEAIEDETKRAKAKEDEILNKVLSLNLETVGDSGKYIKYISQEEGQVTAIEQAFDRTLTSALTHSNAPTTTAVKTALDTEAKSREEEDLRLSQALADEEAARELADSALLESLEKEKARAIKAEGDLNQAIYEESQRAGRAEQGLRDDLVKEEERAKEIEEALKKKLLKEIEDRENGKILGEVYPGQCYNLPYYFAVNYDESTAIVTANTITLDGNKTQKTYSIIIPSADHNLAGLESKEDKITLDKLDSQVPTEGAIRLLGNEAGSGEPYHFVYNIRPEFTATDANIKADTITLDNQRTLTTYDFPIPVAGETAGIVTAEDAKDIRTDLPKAINDEATDRISEVKRLDERIDSLTAKGRFLSVWNAKEGYPETVPTTSPYDYKTGDYYIIGEVYEQHEITEEIYNKRPDGKQFIIGTHSTVKETATIKSNDFYVYDGPEADHWTLLSSTTRTYYFSEIAGLPRDNAALKAELDKIDTDIATEAETRKNGDILENYRSKIGGQTYNLPYYFSADYKADGATVHANTITLDGKGTLNDYTLDIPVANENLAGLESAQDKINLDKLYSQVPDEGAIRLLGKEQYSQESYHFPYHLTINPNADDINIHAHTITFDNEKTLKEYDFDIPKATHNTAGLATAQDKIELDELVGDDAGKGAAIRLLGNEAGSGLPYNFTYYYSIEQKADRITATVNTITLDNNRTLGTYSMDIPAASVDLAGLLSKDDKIKLDALRTLVKGDTVHTNNQAIRIPYYFDVEQSAETIKVTARGVYLDENNQIHWEPTENFLVVPAATNENAGLMTAQDAKDVRANLPKAINDEKERATTSENIIQDNLTQEIADRKQAIKEAIESLDVALVGETGKYLKTIKETDGKIEAIPETFNTAFTPTTATDENAPTTKAVADFVNTYGGKIDSISINNEPALPIDPETKNVKIPLKTIDNFDIYGEGNVQINYNDIENQPIINADLEAEDFIPEIGKYYRHTGTGGGAVSGTPFAVGDSLSKAYFDTTKSVAEMTTFLSGLTYGELGGTYIIAAPPGHSEQPGEITAMTIEGVYILVCYDGTITQSVIFSTAAVAEEGVELGWQNLASDNSFTFTTANAITEINPATGWNGTIISKTAFAPSSQYTTGTIYKCTATSPATYSKIALESDITNEANLRQQADTQLQNNIDRVSDNLAAEITRAKAKETELQTNITAEETRAKAAEQNLTDTKQNNLTADSTARIYKNTAQPIKPGDTLDHLYFNTSYSPTSDEIRAIVQGSSFNTYSIVCMLNSGLTVLFYINTPEGDGIYMMGMEDWLYNVNTGWNSTAIEGLNASLRANPAIVLGEGEYAEYAPYHQEMWIDTLISTLDFPHTNALMIGVNPTTVALQTDLAIEAGIREDKDATLQSNIDTEAATRQTADTNLQNTKQDNLISGTNIKTINDNNILGAGNLEITYDDLKNIPIINQDLYISSFIPTTNAYYKHIGVSKGSGTPITVNDTGISKLYFNTDLVPDFSLFDFSSGKVTLVTYDVNANDFNTIKCSKIKDLTPSYTGEGYALYYEYKFNGGYDCVVLYSTDEFSYVQTHWVAGWQSISADGSRIIYSDGSESYAYKINTINSTAGWNGNLISETQFSSLYLKDSIYKCLSATTPYTYSKVLTESDITYATNAEIDALFS